DFKIIDNQGEKYIKVEDLGFSPLVTADLAGGDTVDEAAAIFRCIIEGEGNEKQNNVVLTNAVFAIKTIHPEKTFGDCYYEAESSLFGKKSLQSLHKLMSA